MKKTLLLLLVTGSAIVGTSSCNKDETTDLTSTPVTQTVNVKLKAGETYSYSLPQNKNNDPYSIITEAQHASLSQLTIDGTGERVYKYTPSTGFLGSDQVVVSNDALSNASSSSQCSGPPRPPHGNCSGSSEDHYVVTINITVEDTTSAVGKNSH